jgi:hypothetical protein
VLYPYLDGAYLSGTKRTADSPYEVTILYVFNDEVEGIDNAMEQGRWHTMMMLAVASVRMQLVGKVKVHEPRVDTEWNDVGSET